MSDEVTWLGVQFRELAAAYRALEGKPYSGFGPVAMREHELGDKAGRLLIRAFKQGYLSFPGLTELVERVENPPPQTGQARWVPCPYNVFSDFCGNHHVQVVPTSDGVKLASDRTTGGIVPTAFPDATPGAMIDSTGHRDAAECQHHVAAVCELLALCFPRETRCIQWLPQPSPSRPLRSSLGKRRRRFLGSLPRPSPIGRLPAAVASRLSGCRNVPSAIA